MITIQLAGDLCIYIFATYLMFYKKNYAAPLEKKIQDENNTEERYTY